MTTLRPFQREGVRAIYGFRGRVLLADEQGLGKTIQALEWVRRIPQRRPVVIVCPASVRYTWQAEAALHFNMRTEVLEGFWTGGRGLPGEIVILNYDILKSWLPVLIRERPQCVILDEIHYCKNISAGRTKAAIKLVKRASSVVGLSGTPLTNRPIELWPVLKIIRPDIFPSREIFAWRYCAPRHTFWGWKYDGATRLPELNRILRSECMIRRLKKDVLPELPDKTRRIVSFKLKSYTEYNRAEQDIVAWLKEFSPARANKARKSKALVKVGYLLRLAAKLKLPQTLQWIEEFFENHPGQKLFALTMHTFVIDYLKERFKHCVVIDGRVTGRRRDEAVRTFQSNRRVNLCLGNWKAAGIGITLHASCNGVGLDFPWTPGDLLQGEDRLHRIGQKKNVWIHYLVALQTIEEKLMKLLRRKSKVLDSILNGKASADDFDIFDELLNTLNQRDANE